MLASAAVATCTVAPTMFADASTIYFDVNGKDSDWEGSKFTPAVFCDNYSAQMVKVEGSLWTAEIPDTYTKCVIRHSWISNGYLASDEKKNCTNEFTITDGAYYLYQGQGEDVTVKEFPKIYLVGNVSGNHWKTTTDAFELKAEKEPWILTIRKVKLEASDGQVNCWFRFLSELGQGDSWPAKTTQYICESDNGNPSEKPGVKTGEDAERNWMISPGTYNMTINLLTMKLQVEKPQFKIHFVNHSDLTGPFKIWAWNESNSSEQLTANGWPGDEMVLVDGVYTWTLPDGKGEPNKVIITPSNDQNNKIIDTADCVDGQTFEYRTIVVGPTGITDGMKRSYYLAGDVNDFFTTPDPEQVNLPSKWHRNASKMVPYRFTPCDDSDSSHKGSEGWYKLDMSQTPTNGKLWGQFKIHDGAWNGEAVGHESGTVDSGYGSDDNGYPMSQIPGTDIWYFELPYGISKNTNNGYNVAIMNGPNAMKHYLIPINNHVYELEAQYTDTEHYNCIDQLEAKTTYTINDGKVIVNAPEGGNMIFFDNSKSNWETPHIYWKEGRGNAHSWGHLINADSNLAEYLADALEANEPKNMGHSNSTGNPVGQNNMHLAHNAFYNCTVYFHPGSETQESNTDAVVEIVGDPVEYYVYISRELEVGQPGHEKSPEELNNIKFYAYLNNDLNSNNYYFDRETFQEANKLQHPLELVPVTVQDNTVQEITHGSAYHLTDNNGLDHNLETGLNNFTYFPNGTSVRHYWAIKIPNGAEGPAGRKFTVSVEKNGEKIVDALTIWNDNVWVISSIAAHGRLGEGVKDLWNGKLQIDYRVYGLDASGTKIEFLSGDQVDGNGQHTGVAYSKSQWDSMTEIGWVPLDMSQAFSDEYTDASNGWHVNWDAEGNRMEIDPRYAFKFIQWRVYISDGAAPAHAKAINDGISTLSAESNASTGTVLYFPNKENFWPSNDPEVLAANNSAATWKLAGQHVYFDLQQAAPAVVTGVDEIMVEDPEAADAVYYNLQGQRVDNPEHGVYIKVSAGRSEKVAL